MKYPPTGGLETKNKNISLDSKHQNVQIAGPIGSGTDPAFQDNGPGFDYLIRSTFVSVNIIVWLVLGCL